MEKKERYIVTVRGPIPADIGERVTRLHAEAIRDIAEREAKGRSDGEMLKAAFGSTVEGSTDSDLIALAKATLYLEENP